MSWQVSQNGVRDGAGIDAPEQESMPVIDDVALDDEVESAQTLGQLLRQEREQRDIPLDQIEQATRIRAAQLRAIEDDRLEALPAEAYARGFVRTYAEYLGLNGDDVVAIFNEQWNRSTAPGRAGATADAGLGRPQCVNRVVQPVGGAGLPAPGGIGRALPDGWVGRRPCRAADVDHACAGHAPCHQPDDQHHAVAAARRSRPACG